MFVIDAPALDSALSAAIDACDAVVVDRCHRLRSAHAALTAARNQKIYQYWAVYGETDAPEVRVQYSDMPTQDRDLRKLRTPQECDVAQARMMEELRTYPRGKENTRAVRCRRAYLRGLTRRRAHLLQLAAWAELAMYASILDDAC